MLLNPIHCIQAAEDTQDAGADGDGADDDDGDDDDGCGERVCHLWVMETWEQELRLSCECLVVVWALLYLLKGGSSTEDILIT